MFHIFIVVLTSLILDAAESSALPESENASRDQNLTAIYKPLTPAVNPTECFQTKPLTPEEIERLRACPQWDDGACGLIGLQEFIRSLRSPGASGP